MSKSDVSAYFLFVLSLLNYPVTRRRYLLCVSSRHAGGTLDAADSEGPELTSKHMAMAGAAQASALHYHSLLSV